MTRVVALLMLAAFCLLGVPVPGAAADESGGGPAATQAAERAPIPVVAHAAEPAAQVSPQRAAGEQRGASGAQSEDGVFEELPLPVPEPTPRLDTAERAPALSAEPGWHVHERGPPRTDRTAA